MGAPNSLPTQMRSLRSRTFLPCEITHTSSGQGYVSSRLRTDQKGEIDIHTLKCMCVPAQILTHVLASWSFSLFPGLPVHHNSQSSLRFMSIESVMPSSHLILCRPLLLLPLVPPSIRVFSNLEVTKGRGRRNTYSTTLVLTRLNTCQNFFSIHAV